ncbi:MAG: PAS domain S-box protein [Burkholderiales bacterium]
MPKTFESLVNLDFSHAAYRAAEMHPFVWNLDSDLVCFQDNVAELIGSDTAAEAHRTMRDLIHPDDYSELAQQARAARDTRGKVWHSPRILCANNAFRWTVLRGGFPVELSSEATVFAGIIVDFHAQRLRQLDESRVLHEYRAVLDALPERVWSKDLKGRFTTVNRAYLEFSDVTRDAIIGKTVGEIHPLAALPKSQEEDAQILATGCATQSENIMYARGQKFIFEVLKSPLRDEAGNIIGTTGLTHDITERHLLQESLAATNRELESLLATCPTGICIVRRRVIERCNPAAAAMLGYAPDELIGKSTRMLYADEAVWRGIGESLYPQNAGTYISTREMEFVRKDGSRAWILMTSNILDTTGEYGIGSWVDISEQKKLAQALLDAKNAADAANRAKSNFLATMSHEIRTPMNGVLGMLELLDATRLDDAQKETLKVVNDSAHALLGLIDGVLDFSKIESGQMEINAVPFDLRQMAEQCQMLYREIATKRGLEFQTDIDPNLAPQLIGDSLRIRQIINNLFSNAIKFTSRGKVFLTIKVEAVTGKSQRLRIEIIDTGIGIDAQAQKKLFQPFVQAEAGTTRRFGGTGLGLSICKHLAEAMGATLRLRSEPGAGTTVTLDIALQVANPVAPAVAPSAAHMNMPRPPAGIRVLVAEDHPVNLNLIARQLKQLGYESDLAEDGRVALELWRKGNYALLLSDCHMPEMDGYELARAIRAAEAASGARAPIPIIACTASALAEEGEQCLAAGMNDVMVKPVSVATLRRHLERWLPVP